MYKPEIVQELLSEFRTGSCFEISARGFTVRVKLPGSYNGWQSFKGDTFGEAYEKAKQWLGLQEKTEADEGRPYVPGQAWNWNSPPGFDKNREKKRR